MKNKMGKGRMWFSRVTGGHQGLLYWVYVRIIICMLD
jgi:hypothetical protein